MPQELSRLEDFSLSRQACEGVSQMGSIQARAMGPILLFLASSVDAVAHTVFVIVKTPVALVLLPFNAIAFCFGKGLPKDLELSSVFVHLFHVAEKVFSAATLPVITLFNPQKAHALVHIEDTVTFKQEISRLEEEVRKAQAKLVETKEEEELRKEIEDFRKLLETKEAEPDEGLDYPEGFDEDEVLKELEKLSFDAAPKLSPKKEVIDPEFDLKMKSFMAASIREVGRLLKSYLEEFNPETLEQMYALLAKASLFNRQWKLANSGKSSYEPQEKAILKLVAYAEMNVEFPRYGIERDVPYFASHYTKICLEKQIIMKSENPELIRLSYLKAHKHYLDMQEKPGVRYAEFRTKAEEILQEIKALVPDDLKGLPYDQVVGKREGTPFLSKIGAIKDRNSAPNHEMLLHIDQIKTLTKERQAEGQALEQFHAKTLARLADIDRENFSADYSERVAQAVADLGSIRLNRYGVMTRKKLFKIEEALSRLRSVEAKDDKEADLLQAIYDEACNPDKDEALQELITQKEEWEYEKRVMTIL